MTRFDLVDSVFAARFADEWMHDYNDQALDAILARCTSDIRWEDPGRPGVGHGHDAVREFLAMTWVAFPDIRFTAPEPAHLALDGSQVIARWAATATMSGPLEPPGLAPTQQPVAFDGVDLWRFRDGRLASYRAIYDVADVARQLGALPARGSGAERAVVASQRIQARARAWAAHLTGRGIRRPPDRLFP